MTVIPDVRAADGTLRLMPSVYSVPWPETNAAFAQYQFPQHLWSVTASEGAFNEHLAELGCAPLPTEGERKLGLLDLVHAPAVDRILDLVSVDIRGLNAAHRAHRYPLHGSAAGIGVLLNHLRAEGLTEIRTLLGDYEGYAAQASTYGLQVRPGTLDDLTESTGEVWFVSQPSAVDGEQLPTELIADLATRNRVVLDLAYAGLQGPTRLSVPDDVWAVLWSLSKPWGLFWRRVGLLACVDEIPGAYATRWFKDPERILATVSTLQWGAASMSTSYRWTQNFAVAALNDAGIPAEAASTVLLARVRLDELSGRDRAQLSSAERIPGSGVARVCLSPLIEELIFANQVSERPAQSR